MEKHKRPASFIKNTTFAGISNGFAVLTSTVVGIIAAKFLGTEGKGQLALVMMPAMIIAQILCLGFDASSSYHIASNKMKPEKVFGAWIITAIISVLFSFFVIYPAFLQYGMELIFRGIPKNLLLISRWVVPLYMSRLIICSMLRGYQKFSREALVNIVMSVTSITAAVVAIIILDYGPANYVRISMMLGFLGILVGFFILRTVMPFKPIFGLKYWVSMFQYGYKMVVSRIFTLIDLRLDIFFINYYLNNSIVGIYTVAGALSNVFWIATTSISMVLFPRAASLGPEESKKLTCLICRNFLWLTVIFGGLFLLICKPLIVFVYDEKFAPAAGAFALLLPGIIGGVISRICFTDCSARGYPGRSSIAAAITATMTIIFDLLLIPKHGMYGAAVASSIAYCTGGVLGIYWHMKLSGNTLSSLILPRKDDLKYYINTYTKIKNKFCSSRSQ